MLVLADSNKENCNAVIDIILSTIRELEILHSHSPINKHLTISIGVALSTEITKVPLNYHHKNLLIQPAAPYIRPSKCITMSIIMKVSLLGR
ncbi:MAG: hypothetical protein ACI9FJ_002394 [Alteromonadaceae bacterium]